MTTLEALIPRDAEITGDRVLRFEFTGYVELPVKDMLGDMNVSAATLDEVEAWVTSRPSPENLLLQLREMGYGFEVTDQRVRLAPVLLEDYVNPPRFEQEWERRERLEGRQSEWGLTRRWLDGVPASTSVGASSAGASS